MIASSVARSVASSTSGFSDSAGASAPRMSSAEKLTATASSPGSVSACASTSGTVSGCASTSGSGSACASTCSSGDSAGCSISDCDMRSACSFLLAIFFQSDHRLLESFVEALALAERDFAEQILLQNLNRLYLDHLQNSQEQADHRAAAALLLHHLQDEHRPVFFRFAQQRSQVRHHIADRDRFIVDLVNGAALDPFHHRAQRLHQIENIHGQSGVFDLGRELLHLRV